MAHLRSAPRKLRVFRPGALDLFAADAADTLHVMERELVMALLFVCAEVILWDCVTKPAWPLRYVEFDVIGKHLHPLEKEFGPITHDVVQSDGLRQLAVDLQAGSDNIVHITISVERPMSTREIKHSTKTYRSPFCKSPTELGITMPCRAQTTSPTPVAAYPFAYLTFACVMAAKPVHVLI